MFFLGLEEVDESENQRRRLSSQDAEGADYDLDYDSLGDFVQAGATGAKRKLMSMGWKVRARRPCGVVFFFFFLVMNAIFYVPNLPSSSFFVYV